MKNEFAPIGFTAFRVMFYVALEQYQPVEGRLIHDALARKMLPSRLKLLVDILRLKPLRHAFIDLIERDTPGLRGGLCRKRYIDEKVEIGINRGIDAVVILGAGLDTRAYRIPELFTKLVYEVDLPGTIAYKERKLQQLYGSVPVHVRLIPLDFDRQRLDEVLYGNGYSPKHKSFFIWEGVTQYISEAAVRTVFEFLAKAMPGSQMAFTYILKDFINGERFYGLDKLYRRTRKTHQIWQFGLLPPQVETFIGEYSWNELEQVGAEEYHQCYLNPLGRTEAVMEIERVVFAEKSGDQSDPY